MGQFLDRKGKVYGTWRVIDRDLSKNAWCKNHHIPIIRIPYTHLSNIVLEDLVSKTSQYLLQS